jgi:hypothetical protein
MNGIAAQGERRRKTSPYFRVIEYTADNKRIAENAYRTL